MAFARNLPVTFSRMARVLSPASILFDDPPVLRDKLLAQVARGFRAIKMGWRPFGRVSRKLDELLVKTARETVGGDVELMVDAGKECRVYLMDTESIGGDDHRTPLYRTPLICNEDVNFASAGIWGSMATTMARVRSS